MREHQSGEGFKLAISGYGNTTIAKYNLIYKNMKKIKSDWFFRKEKLMKINRIMRLTILMLMCVNLSLSAKVFSQTEKFSVQKQNATVKEIFNEIMSQSNYHFFYNNEFDADRKVNLNVKNADIDVIIKKLLEGQGYSYKLMDNYVIIKRDNVQVKPQDHSVKIDGIVKDADGNPLPGVTVMIGGTTIGVATDIDGKFSFKVPGPGTVLIVSFVGKKPQEIVVGDKTHFDVVLLDDQKVLEEVVCTGFQTISRERATGSFEILGADALNKTLTSGVVSRMEGKIAGVQIDRNNRMTIRGRGSLYSSTEPLVVVDGFPIEAGIESVNPDDIANITVLKDAAAASIWGVRAANGVVVITTKAGQVGTKPTFEVSYLLTINSKDDYKDLHLLSPSNALDYQLERIQKGLWTAETYVDKHYAVNKVQEAYYNAMKRSGQSDYASVVASDAQFNYEISELRKANLYKQYEQELLRRAVSNRLNLSLRGGTEKNNYYLSAVYDHQVTGDVGRSNDDLLVNFKNDYQVAKRLTFSSGVNIRYNKAENNGMSLLLLTDQAPFENLLDKEGNRIQYYMVDPWEGKNREEMGYYSYTTNLLDKQEDKDYTTNLFSARLQAALKLNILKGLDIETRFQYERSYTKNEDYASAGSAEMRQLINDNTHVKDGQLVHNFPEGGRFSLSKSELEAWTWRSQMTYNGDWKDSEHQLAAVLGYEMRLYRTMGHSNIQYGYDPQALTYVPIDESAWQDKSMTTWFDRWSSISGLNSSGESDNRDVSAYLNAAYTFKNRYSVSASGRIDQSNLFGNDSDYNYNFIWSAGLSWRISEEEFAKTDWLDQLTLRATYGIGGNVYKGVYPVLMGEKTVLATTGVSFIRLTNPANKDLTWEKATTLNVGVDFAFLNHRIGGNLDYYHKKGTDLIGRVALDPTNGFFDAKMNFASILNQGVEFTLNTTPLVINDFSWNLGFNISYNKNEVTKIQSEGTTDVDYLNMAPAVGSGAAIIGKPLGRLYSYRYAGLDAEGKPMLWQNGKKVGYKDFERLPSNLKYEGTTEAPWYGGVNTSFEYKGITLSANATCKFGHKFRVPTGFPGDVDNGYADIADRWREGHTDTNVPVMLDVSESNAQNSIYQFYALSDMNVRDAAYLRLNEVAIGYSLPKGLIAKTPFKLINVQFQMRNLALWTANKEHIDPEAVIAGNLYNTYTLPQTRSFVLGVKLTF